ncbi:MAG: hypothetical protein ACHQD6_09935 [Steroidobacterales bacterium]|jgi:hypothetical protein
MEAIDNLSTLVDKALGSLGQAARTLVWAVAALVCAIAASILGMTAIIVSLWDARPVLALVAPGIGFAVLAVVFGAVAVRALRAQRAATAVSSGTLTPWSASASQAAPDVLLANDRSDRRLRPLTWLIALLSLVFLGGSRELIALALRFRAVLVLIAHAVHVLQLFSRRRQPPL